MTDLTTGIAIFSLFLIVGCASWVIGAWINDELTDIRARREAAERERRRQWGMPAAWRGRRR